MEETIKVISEAGKEAIAVVINKTTGDNHPEYERAVVLGTTEAIKEIAKSDVKEATRIYQQIKNTREQRDFLNFSRVLRKFASLVQTKPKEPPDESNDFFWNMFDYAKEVSHDQMQDLIAKILASEYNNPKTYSTHTLQVIKSTDAKILDDFSKLLGCNLKNRGILKDLFTSTETYISLGLNYSDFLNLQNIGLIATNESQYQDDKSGFKDIYVDKLISFKVNPETSSDIPPEFYSLTRAGGEISQHLEVSLNQNYIDWLKQKYEQEYIIEI